ncbi:MAG: RES family NAD+ phosphorylase [Burkholderiales bacterium]
MTKGGGRSRICCFECNTAIWLDHRASNRQKKHIGFAFVGQKRLRLGGRWHRKGVLVAYCAQSLSLAALEFFVHFGRHERHIALVALQIAIPESLLEEMNPAQLPVDWRAEPPSASTADLGMKWLTSARSAVLRVPSAISPGEYNFVINASHPRVARVKIEESQAYTFDPRMWR